MNRSNIAWRFSMLIPALAACLALTGTNLVAATTGAGADWPTFRGPNRDGLSQETGWSAKWGSGGPRELWRVSVGIGFSTTSVAGGRVYTMGNKNETDIVWCLDASTGKEIWTHKYPCRVGKYRGTRMTPTVDGDLVYTLSREGDLFCLTARDGKVRWSKNVKQAFGVRQTRYDWGFACSPLVLGNDLILDLGKTIALNKKTGEPRWVTGNDESGFSSPTTIQFKGKTYITSYNAFGLVLVDAATGKEMARHPWEVSYRINAATPIPWGDKIFISSGYGKGCALLKVGEGSLTPVYENKNMRNHVNSCVLYKEHLYGIDGQHRNRGKLTCLDIATGEVKWAQPGMPVGSLMIAGGKILAMLDGGELLIAEAAPGAYREIARAKVLGGRCWTHPVLVGGRIYCRSNEEGELVCLDVKAR